MTKKFYCDLCGKTNLKFLLRHRLLGGPLYVCKNCGLVQVKPAEDNILIEDGQSLSERKNKYKRAGQTIRTKLSYDSEVERCEEHYKERNWIERLRKIQMFKKNGKLLEIGGGGQFLNLARKCGYEVYGVEPLEASCKQAK